MGDIRVQKLNNVDMQALWDMYTSGYVLDEEICALFGLSPRELDHIVRGRWEHAQKSKAQVAQRRAQKQTSH